MKRQGNIDYKKNKNLRTPMKVYTDFKFVNFQICEE